MNIQAVSILATCLNGQAQPNRRHASGKRAISVRCRPADHFFDEGRGGTPGEEPGGCGAWPDGGSEVRSSAGSETVVGAISGVGSEGGSGSLDVGEEALGLSNCSSVSCSLSTGGSGKSAA